MRRRLIASIAGVSAAAVLLFALPLAAVIRSNHRNEELLRLQRDAVASTRQIDVGSGGPGDRIELPRTRDRLGVYDVRGRRVAGRGPATADGVVGGALHGARPGSRAGDGRLTAAVPLLSAERVTGVVRVERDDRALAGGVRDALLALAAGALLVVALAVAAAVVLGRRLAAPLERLAEAAQRLGDGDFASRAPRVAVPELDAVGAALNTTAERLDQLISRERAFSADASHQLRTPLAAVRLELEAVDLRGQAPPEVAAALSQVDRLEGTIDTLLAVARDAPERDAQTDLAPLLDALELRWRGPLGGQGRALRTLLGAPRLVAKGSARVIEEILEVLLDNADRHGCGTVTVRVRDTAGWLAIEVGDEGAGPAGDLELVFARRSGSASGHGIGLALARSLATAEGGSLTAFRAGTGVVFTLRLRAGGRET